MLVSVVIPSRNGARFLRPCLAALSAAEHPPRVHVEVIVVDNGSTDGSADLVRSFPDCQAVVVDRPLGFSEACNAARPVARGEVVLFLNNDTAVQPAFLRRPLELLASDPGVAAVGSKLLFMHPFVALRFRLPEGARALVDTTVFDGPLDPKIRWSADVSGEKAVAGRRGRWVRDGSRVYLPVPIPGLDASPSAGSLAVRVTEGGAEVESVGLELAGGARAVTRRSPGTFALDGYVAWPSVRLVQSAGSFLNSRAEGGDFGSGLEDGDGRFETEECVPAICGAALFVRRTSLDAAGWFPTYYRMYYEDSDLSLRLRQRGGQLVLCPSSVVDHYHTGTNREHSPQFVEHVAASHLLFVFRFGSPWLQVRLVVRSVKRAARELRSRRGAPLRDRWASAHATRGVVDGLRRLWPVARERLADRLSGRPLSGLLGFQRRVYPPDA